MLGIKEGRGQGQRNVKVAASEAKMAFIGVRKVIFRA